MQSSPENRTTSIEYLVRIVEGFFFFFLHTVDQVGPVWILFFGLRWWKSKKDKKLWRKINVYTQYKYINSWVLWVLVWVLWLHILLFYHILLWFWQLRIHHIYTLHTQRRKVRQCSCTTIFIVGFIFIFWLESSRKTKYYKFLWESCCLCIFFCNLNLAICFPKALRSKCYACDFIWLDTCVPVSLEIRQTVQAVAILAEPALGPLSRISFRGPASHLAVSK